MHDTFLQIKAADELGGYDGTCFHNSADALASVLELVRQHKGQLVVVEVELPKHG